MKAYFIALVASLTSITSTTSATSIIFTGDILLDRGVRKVIEHHGTSYLFDKQVDSILGGASNLAAGNKSNSLSMYW